MATIQKQVLVNMSGIVGVVGGTTALVVLDVFSPWVFILAAIACIPMVKALWSQYVDIYYNPIRILRKVLPKIGFTIENAEWNSEHTRIEFVGRYLDNNFKIEACPNVAFFTICHFPWSRLPADDPHIPLVLEAINEVNADSSNMSVVLQSPDEQGMRYIYTECQTIMPPYSHAGYMNFLLTHMLNRRPAYEAALCKERSYVHLQAARRGPVGFGARDISEDSAPTQEDAAPVVS